MSDKLLSDESRFHRHSDAFIVERWRPKASKKGADEFPRVRICAEAYNALLEVAAQSGLSLCAIASKAIAFALEHLEYVDTE